MEDQQKFEERIEFLDLSILQKKLQPRYRFIFHNLILQIDNCGELGIMNPISPRTYLVLYCFIFVALGIFVSSIGALIPYLSDQRGKPLTQYSFLFVARTIGTVIGYIIYRYLQKLSNVPSQHMIFIICGIGFQVFLVMFVKWQSTIGEWVSMILLGIVYYLAFTCVNIALLKVSGKKAGRWVTLAHGNFGIGALLSPLLIRISGINSYLYSSFLFSGVSALCFYFPNPEQQQCQQTAKIEDKPKIVGTYNLHLLASLMIFLNMGAVLTVPSWLPSYAILSGVADKDKSTIYGTIYWSMNTAFKLLTSAWTATASYKLNFYYSVSLINGVLCLFLHFTEDYGQVALFGSFLYGATFSSTFALLLSAPGEYGIFFKPQHTANMMISSVLSYGVITGVTGQLMKYNLVLLLLSLFAMSIALRGLLSYFLDSMELLSKNGSVGTEMKEQLVQK